MDGRPNPETILKQVNQEMPEEKRRGRLEIFFGYAAGVGKTYAMLSCAKIEREAGKDIVAGYVEPHARPETQVLMDGLEQIPPLEIPYRGITLREFDLDAALKRKPEVILVDELAHTNARNCRHAKRYQDIIELLEAGIDVYTTVNVQHLESLNDIVASITRVVVRERIPDSIFDEADKVRLVDIEPEELIHRLNEGKVYQDQQAKQAVHNFFLQENLTALREIALRKTAARVNRQVNEDRAIKNNQDYYTGEHILICISPSPTNVRVIRTAARMANAFQGEFTALFVEGPGFMDEDEKIQKGVFENIKLAKEFGAKVVTVFGENIPYQISEYAKQNGVSKIVLGRPPRYQRIINLKPSLIDSLTGLLPNVDIYVIPDQNAVAQRSKNITKLPRIKGKDLIKMLGIVVASTSISLIIDYFGMGEANIVTIYLLGVLLVSAVTEGVLCGVVSSLLSVVVFNYFFTDPRLSLQAYDPTYPFTFATMLCAALVTSSLTMRLHAQAKLSAAKANGMEVLLNTSNKLRRAMTASAVLDEAANRVMALLNRNVILYKTLEGRLDEAHVLIRRDGMEEEKNLYLTGDERAVAAWVYNSQHKAGRSTDTLPGAKALYIPIYSGERTYGVLGIGLVSKEDITPFEQNLLKAMLNEVAFAAEKYVLNEQKKEMNLQQEKEKLRENMLRAISHDLRTPLTGISGCASLLVQGGGDLDDGTKREIYANIYEDSQWLIHLVENLLYVTKLGGSESGIEKQEELVADLVREAISKTPKNLGEPLIRMRVEDTLVVKCDGRMIIQVLLNFIDNALRYTENCTSIEISAKQKRNRIAFEVADDGGGISDSDKEKVFDEFFTSENNTGDSRRGLGLGLSLCKSIIDAHGGKIYVRDNQPKGSVFGFEI